MRGYANVRMCINLSLLKIIHQFMDTIKKKQLSIFYNFIPTSILDISELHIRTSAHPKFAH
jgi:hypothetical protein